MERKIKVLHITPDEKFFDGVFSRWENDENFSNKALFYTCCKNYQLKHIKRTNVLEIYYKFNDISDRLQKDDYDAVFVHSMPFTIYKIISIIPENKIVIWWGWGFDIYNRAAGLPPIVKTNLYKDKTQQFVNKNKYSPGLLLYNFRHFFKRKKVSRYQAEAIRRIDYYQPVIKLEMDLMRQNVLFRAKEFYYKDTVSLIEPMFPHPANGDIILGNSATETNNHLDVLDYVQKYKMKDQKIIMPLSYGNEKYRSWLKPHLISSDIHPIYDFMPRDDYFSIVNKCSYAIYGVIRQQAMGNIFYAVSHGIKVFLYKDSLVYQNMKNLGYVVFAIEDMTEDSFKTPLTIEQIEQNNRAILAEYNRRLAVYNECLKEMREKIQIKSHEGIDI